MSWSEPRRWFFSIETGCQQASEAHAINNVPVEFIFSVNTFHIGMMEKKQFNTSWLFTLVIKNVRIQQKLCLTNALDRHKHTRCGTKNTRGGALRQAAQGQQGLFDQSRGPTGHWALTAYATVPTYRQINPHFISHICSIAPKQTGCMTRAGRGCLQQ